MEWQRPIRKTSSQRCISIQARSRGIHRRKEDDSFEVSGRVPTALGQLHDVGITAAMLKSPHSAT